MEPRQDATVASGPARPGTPATSGYWFVEHTSEVEVQLRAPTLAALFTEAAFALAELLAGQPVVPGDDAHEPVLLQAMDRDALLVDWLNELLFLTERDGRVFNTIRIEKLTGGSLQALVGAGDGEPRTSVKAATLHGLDIEGTPEGGYAARVILDV